MPKRAGDSFCPAVSLQNLARIVMLATYMQYSESTRQNSNLIMSGRTKGQRPMDKKEVQNILQVGKDTLYKFLYDMGQAGLLNEVSGGGFEINNQLFSRGRLSRKKDCIAPTVWLSIPRYQRLYKENSKNVKEIGTALRLLPFVHRSEYVLCWNPYERDLAAIDTLTFTDIRRVLGMSTNNVAKYKKHFEDCANSITFNDIPDRQRLFTFNEQGYGNSRYAVSVNRKLVYFKELMS